MKYPRSREECSSEESLNENEKLIEISLSLKVNRYFLVLQLIELLEIYSSLGPAELEIVIDNKNISFHDFSGSKYR